MKDTEKKYGIERLKALGAIVFEGSTNLTDAKAWLNLVEKFFRVMIFLRRDKLDTLDFYYRKMLRIGGNLSRPNKEIHLPWIGELLGISLKRNITLRLIVKRNERNL